MNRGPNELQVIDDSGLLSLVDVEAYEPFVSEDWTYERIVQHFEQQMAKQSLFVWHCGDGGGQYSIEVRHEMTGETGFRSVLGGVTVSGNGLYVVSYDALTMAAQFADEKLPSRHEADAHIPLEQGYYRVRIVQRFDPMRTTETPNPDFVIELEPGEGPILAEVPWL